MISPGDFIIIGENIHATRIIPRSSPRMGTDQHGREAVVFEDGAGTTRHLPIPEAERETRDYRDGRIKHVRVAVQMAMQGEEPDASTALAYLEAMVRSQVGAGADYLDLNVDEVSLQTSEQIEAMRWLVRTVGQWASVPLAIDSPNLEIVAAGLEEAARGPGGLPMVNSASLERPEALELAVKVGGPVVVTAAGESGIPGDADGRIANATRIVELAQARGIPLGRLYVDPLVFPISVDGASGAHCLAAFRALRERFGPEIHLTGGMSNVSFGLPIRRLVNDAFFLLAVEAGADSGIVDPIQSNPERVFALDRSSRPFQLAVDVLTGADPHCRAYIKAFRAGELGE